MEEWPLYFIQMSLIPKPPPLQHQQSSCLPRSPSHARGKDIEQNGLDPQPKSARNKDGASSENVDPLRRIKANELHRKPCLSRLRPPANYVPSVKNVQSARGVPSGLALTTLRWKNGRERKNQEQSPTSTTSDETMRTSRRICYDGHLTFL